MPYQEPEFLPWDGRRVPLTFVGGYLGAGKTTAINLLLASADRPIAVLVNDVGEINVDASLIKRRHGDTIELTDGCVCCSLVDGFGAAFDQIRARDVPPDHVIVELSGAADLSNVTPWGRSAGFVLDGVVIVVAADQLVSGTEPPGTGPPGTGHDEMPERVRAAIEAHIGEADLLVLTKTSLVGVERTESARARLAELAPHTPVLLAPDVDSIESSAIGAFLGLGGRRSGGFTDVAEPTLFDAHEVRRIDIPSVSSLADLHTALDVALDELRRRDDVGTIMRAKGVIATTDDALWLVQIVGARREVTPMLISEWQAPTGLVVITLR